VSLIVGVGPPRVASEPVLRRRELPLFLFLTVLELAAIVGFLLYWFVRADWSSHPIALAILSAPLLVGVAMFESRWLALPLMRRPLPMPARRGWRVGVATTFVAGTEPIDMLEETVRAIVAMDYPHESWVLDEDDQPDVRALCERLGARHFSRKGRAGYESEDGRFAARTKHGNYNAWLFDSALDRYDVIVAFDPDHVPDRDFLVHILGYFADPEVGYVQAAQVYYNQAASLVARGAAEETYAYYSSIQMSSYAVGYPIVTGCHNAHRSVALRDVGGFAAHEADDLLITVLYRARGWKGVYVPQRLAVGLTPVDWGGYLRQQRRWARSVLDVKLRVFPKLAPQLRVREGLLSFAHGLYQLHGLATALLLALLVYMLVTGSAPRVVSVETVPPAAALLCILVACDFYRQRFFLEPGSERGFHWRAGILRLAKWPWVLMAAWDAVTRRYGPYIVTPKARSGARQASVVAPHLVVAVIVALAWAVGIALGRVTDPILHVIAALVIAASVAVAFASGRTAPAPYDSRLRREAMGARRDADSRRAPDVSAAPQTADGPGTDRCPDLPWRSFDPPGT
jgi:cellulose synthase (UDP-forming)